MYGRGEINDVYADLAGFGFGVILVPANLADPARRAPATAEGRRRREQDLAGAVLACTCLLNHFYGDPAARAEAVGEPLAFGEVACQLLGRALVRLSITDVAT